MAISTGALPSYYQILPAIECASIAVAVYRGPDHIILFANEAYARLIGRAPCLNESLFVTMPSLQGGEFHQLLDKVLQTGCSVLRTDVCERLGWPTGAARQVNCDLSYAPWRDEQGQVAGVICVAVDKAAQVAAERRAAKSEQSLQAVIDGLPHAVFVSDNAGKLLFANAKWQRLTGQRPEQMDKYGWYALVHPSDASLVREYWHKAQGERQLEVCARLRDKESGEYRWQQIVALPVSGDVVGKPHWIGTWTDLTNRVVAEQRNEQMRQRFVSMVGHDLRSPLTAIRVNAESVLRHCDDDKLRQKMQRIVRTVEQTNTMLESLLNINLLDSEGELPVSFAPIDLLKYLDVTVANFSSTHGERFVTQLPAHVQGFWHGTTLVRAIENLINNAFKYGSPHAPVTLSVAQAMGHTKICVHNEGTPLSGADVQKIFLRYERLGADQGAHAKPGWGLGLTFTKAAAKAHGGEITVDSSAEHGTTFCLRIPNNSQTATRRAATPVG